MAFGKEQGYPASHRQVQQLEELVVAAGHADFRDARGALGLTQRQAAGKFTRDEADALIARLEAEAEAEAGRGDAPGGPPRASTPPMSRREAQQVATARGLPDHVLAAELQRRGWIVCEP
jgi:hypothetical protein